MDRKLKIAQRLGAKLVVQPRTMNNGMRVAVLSDTLGAVFAIAQPVEE
jgi:predicted enzyme related to lactoylglutathione lyase